MAQGSFGKEREKMEPSACKIRESVEKYTGLSRVRVEINSDAMPDRREMELCRVAGRKGDDLLLAGLCIRRRNVARINAHLDRARTDLVHALAELREQVDVNRLSSHTSAQPLCLLSEAVRLTGTGSLTPRSLRIASRSSNRHSFVSFCS